MATRELDVYKRQTRSEHNITAILQGFVTDSLTHLAHQVGVPGRSQTGSNREAGGKVATAVTFAMSIDMNSGRTITLNGSRNAETRDGYSSCLLYTSLFGNI